MQVRQALPSSVEAQISLLEDEYNQLLSKYDLREIKKADLNPEQARLAELSSVFKAVDALKQIEADLQLFLVQMNSSDEETRARARSFHNEFVKMRDEIEGELSRMFSQ